MASSVKRFIYGFLLLCFVALIALQVKPVLGQTVLDTVTAIKPPFELTLKKTGPVRLAGLFYDKNNTTLTSLVTTGERVRVHIVTDKPDRYGRKAVHLYLKDHTWVQGTLVANKQATPYPYPGEERLIRDLYLLEDPTTLSALNDTIPINDFAIVEGTVVDVATVKGTTYLNFGANWRDDFTVKVEQKDLKKFHAFTINLPKLKGKPVRVRGWVFEQNGPMMVASHPAQIERLGK